MSDQQYRHRFVRGPDRHRRQPNRHNDRTWTCTDRPHSFLQSALDRAVKLENKVHKSWWNLAAPGYEGFNVDKIKLSGEVTPFTELDAAYVPEGLKAIINTKPLSCMYSKLACTLYVDKASDAKEYFEQLLKDLKMTSKLVSVDIQGSSKRLIFSAADAVAAAVCFPGRYEVARPKGIVLSRGSSIWTNPNTQIVSNYDHDFPKNSSNMHVFKLGTKRVALICDHPNDNSEKIPLFTDYLLEADELAEGKVPVASFARYANKVGKAHPPSRFMLIFNVLPVLSTLDAILIEEVHQQIKTECQKYGCVASIKTLQSESKISKTLVEFTTQNACKKAVGALGGRIFSGRPILTAYMSESQLSTTLTDT